MRIALIGAAGQLGHDLLEVLDADVCALDLPAFDVTDAAQVDEVLRAERPDCVINCAAATNVDGCEDDPEAAWRVNALGAGYVAQAAAALRARVVFISTDYVFGLAGARDAAYVESDPPGPISMYGVTKLAGEYLTAAGNRRHLIVRSCGLYGHAGARGKGGNFVETIRRLARERASLRIVHDQRLSPTSTRALADRLARLLDTDATGTLHVAARDHCTWYEFAQAIVELVGADTKVEPIRSCDYPMKARRPAMSALSSERLAHLGIEPCPPWREMLAQYLQDR